MFYIPTTAKGIGDIFTAWNVEYFRHLYRYHCNSELTNAYICNFSLCEGIQASLGYDNTKEVQY